MEKVAVKKLREGAILPTFGSPEAAGADLYVCLEQDVTIAPGAEVEGCVIMNDAVIGEGSELRYVILDKNVTVRPGSKLIGTKKNPIIIKRGEIV